MEINAQDPAIARCRVCIDGYHSVQDVPLKVRKERFGSTRVQAKLREGFPGPTLYSIAVTDFSARARMWFAWASRQAAMRRVTGHTAAWSSM